MNDLTFYLISISIKRLLFQRLPGHESFEFSWFASFGDDCVCVLAVHDFESRKQ